jgi:glycosyltransferase involved in cell wall biosynthesis
LSAQERPLRLLWLGTYERDYTRTRVLMAGLRELGVEVLECHRPLWELTRHKAGSFLSAKGLPRIAGQVLSSWGSIASEQRRFAGVDAVVAGYPHQPDALPAAVFARGRRVPLVVDAMISMSDTLAGDRARVGAGVGRALAALDTATLRCADVVIADTTAHARYYESRFGVPADRIGVARLGAETDVFKPAPPAPGTPRALFYGKLAPLHGLDTLLDAARVPGTPPVRLVGDGQLGGWLADELRRDAPAGFEHVPWIEHERLGEELARAGICLGVFGRSEKAARVVPNKVYHAMSVGRPVITADTPAAREVLEHERNALLVPPGDAPALAAAMTRLGEDEALRRRLGEAARERFVAVASQTVVARDFLAALKRSPRLGARAAARVPVGGA